MMATPSKKLKIVCPTNFGSEKTISINAPKSGLTLSEIQSVINLAAETKFFLKNGEFLTGSVNSVYYEEVVITEIVN